MLNNTLLPPLNAMYQKPSLGLNQIEGFTPMQEFTDDSNTHWALVKASSVSTVDIPDPKNIQFVDYWNHEYPNLKTKLYVYVVEGIKPPRVETEQPTRVLYQWFSTLFVPTFNPQMITDKEWLKANVYAAPIINTRMSKLQAICHLSSGSIPMEETDALIHVEELSNADNKRNPA